MHELFLGQQKAGEPINLTSFGNRFFNGNLAGERRKIAVTDFYLDGVGCQMPVLEPFLNVRRLFFETSAQDLPVTRRARRWRSRTHWPDSLNRLLSFQYNCLVGSMEHARACDHLNNHGLQGKCTQLQGAMRCWLKYAGSNS